MKTAIWVPNHKASNQHSRPQRLRHLMVPLKERMTSLWPRCGKWFCPIFRGYRSVTALWHRATEKTSCETLSFPFLVVAPRLTSLAAFAGAGVERLRLRTGHSRWFNSVSLLLIIGVAPLFPKRDLIPLNSRRKQVASVNTRIRCSVWPGEITETLHTLNIGQQLELLQMYDCSLADWKIAQFHNKVAQKHSAFGQFYPGAACSTDSILWWLGAEPPCDSDLVFILCGLHINKCTQMDEDLLWLPTGQL